LLEEEELDELEAEDDPESSDELVEELSGSYFLFIGFFFFLGLYGKKVCTLMG
jgi:hypothetical protein